MVRQNKILQEASSILVNDTIITGGHFRIFFEDGKTKEYLNPGTIKSFEYATRLYLNGVKKGLKVAMGILINDMSSSCEEDGCKLPSCSFSRQNYNIPQPYLDLLASFGLPKDSVEIFWEKQARNKGKKAFLKTLKHSLHDDKKGILSIQTGEPGQTSNSSRAVTIKKEAAGFFMEEPQSFGRIILTRTGMGSRDKYGTPACPLIMAGLSLQQCRKYTRSINFYYTGDDNTRNIPNYFVIEKAKKVTSIFGCLLDIQNLYFREY